MPSIRTLAALSTLSLTAWAQSRTMGFIGCSMAENVATGYVNAGGQRMWGPYGTGALVVQSWTDPNSPAWQLFDQQVAQNGLPDAVWVQICIFAAQGATFQEVTQLVNNARAHAADGATIYISGQPVYTDGSNCFLAGQGGPQLTDDLAKQAAADPSLDVIYPGQFTLTASQTIDSCHANDSGLQTLGQQALSYFG